MMSLEDKGAKWQRETRRDEICPAGELAVAWAFTGAGHFLRESVEMTERLQGRIKTDIFFSMAASEVLSMYGLIGRLNGMPVTVERGRSFPVTSKFSAGKYAALVISPATSNTVAKCVHGIADSLVSCMFAQAGKSRVPICVLPTDTADEMESVAPNGNRVMVYPRPVDLEVTRKLGEMRGVVAVSSPGELQGWLDCLNNINC
jgi:flavoprotein